MRTLLGADGHVVGLGLSSLVLGVIALLVAFMPVLGVPLSLFGLAFGGCGLVLALLHLGPSLRTSAGGIVTCLTALVLNLAIAYAPSGYLPEPRARENFNPHPDRPSAPPPAPGQWFD